jgi:hypothetical protein
MTCQLLELFLWEVAPEEVTKLSRCKTIQLDPNRKLKEKKLTFHWQNGFSDRTGVVLAT